MSNPDQVLSDIAVEQINSSLKSLENSTTIQVAVAVVNSIGNDDPHDFGVELFEYWGIGQKNKDNGLLILLVMDQHAIEFITGKGTEGVLTDVVCKRIQEDYMVPLARENNFDQCVITGVAMAVKTLEQPESVDYLYEERSDSSASASGSDDVSGVIFISIALLIYWVFLWFLRKEDFKSTAPAYLKSQNKLYYYTKIIFLNIGLPMAFLTWQFVVRPLPCWQNLLFFYGWIVLLHFEKRIRLNVLVNKMITGKDQDGLLLYNTLNKSHNGWAAAAFLAPFPFLFYHLWIKGRLRSIRNHPRKCDECGNQMIKSNEGEDDEYLKPSEQLEEKIKSVDYDIWRCSNCSSLKKYEFPALYSKYKACPQCSAKAFYSKSKKTVVSPSYSSTGEGMEYSECLHCKFHDEKKYTIAKLTRSSSSGSSGFSSSSSSGSSGSSFGGGSSGGGGAGSRW